MDGITVLYTYTYSPNGVGKIMAFLFCLLMAVTFTIWTIGSLASNEKKNSLITSIIALISFTACFFISNIKLNSHERYEVIVDDSVSLSEFSEKYDIIKVRGEIYTIERRVD